MNLKDVCILWSGDDASVTVVPREWLKSERTRWDGKGVEAPTKEDLANPAAFFLRQFVSMTYEVGVKPDDVVSAFNQIKEFVELTHEVADGDLDAFADEADENAVIDKERATALLDAASNLIRKAESITDKVKDAKRKAA